ncbi:hypothetical protein ACT5GY_09530 [Lactiplantibacillus plantarum]
MINYAMAHQNQYMTVDDLKNTIQEMLVKKGKMERKIRVRSGQS